MKVEELKKILEENGYCLTYVKHFKTHDRIRIDKKDFKLIINLKKHIEDVPIEAITKYLLIKGEGEE
jgi:hypothetical protein